MFAGSIFLFLTADILQEYANHEDSRSLAWRLAAREFCKKKKVESSKQSSKYEQEERNCAFLPSWQESRP